MLINQTEYPRLNESIVQIDEPLRGLEQQQRALDEEYSAARIPTIREFES